MGLVQGRLNQKNETAQQIDASKFLPEDFPSLPNSFNGFGLVLEP
jgi:hypothetical protein